MRSHHIPIRVCTHGWRLVYTTFNLTISDFFLETLSFSFLIYVLKTVDACFDSSVGPFGLDRSITTMEYDRGDTSMLIFAVKKITRAGKTTNP